MNPEDVKIVKIKRKIIDKPQSGWGKVLSKMKIDDGFFVPKGELHKDGPSAYLGVYAKRLGIKLASKRTEGGHMVWRVE